MQWQNCNYLRVPLDADHGVSIIYLVEEGPKKVAVTETHWGKTLEMEKPRYSHYCLVLLSLLCWLDTGSATESPRYEVVHIESDFEIRLYRESTWMSAQSNEASFQKATLFGFHRLFQYIQGANLNYSRIPMTTPVVTSIVPGAGPFRSSSYFVRLYLPTKFQDDPPVPLSELNLEPYARESHHIAVRKFYGQSTDFNIVEEAKKLAISLSMSSSANATTADTDNAYSIAQYDPPFRFIGRVNEVWVDVTVSGINGSESRGAASY